MHNELVVYEGTHNEVMNGPIESQDNQEWFIFLFELFRLVIYNHINRKVEHPVCDKYNQSLQLNSPGLLLVL